MDNIFSDLWNKAVNSPLVELSPRTDGRGALLALESGDALGFDLQRVYFLYDLLANQPRGFHAHLALHQLMICTSGACTVRLESRTGSQSYRLDRPTLGLRIGPMVWREMHDFAPGTVVMVLASAPYDESDYIRSHEAFRQMLAVDHTALVK